MMPDEPIELDEAAGAFAPAPDRRPRMAEPIPVRLVTVDDATLPAAAGVEVELDAFYVGLLRFVRDESDRHAIVYHADNFDLRMQVIEPPVRRDDLRPLGIEVPSLTEVERGLIEREIEFTRHRSLIVGQDSLVLLDPAGNWVQLTESRAV
jgi:hypothetical protein